MSRFGQRWILAGLMTGVAAGQMHKVARPEQVVRAVGVYEWTGELGKPKGMRLVPVTIFIDGKVEDAAVYLARPIPMALQGGTIYELDEAGMQKGLLDLMSARHVQIPDAADLPPYDDGWFGYGKFEPPPAPKASSSAIKKPSGRASMNGKPLDDDSKPHFGKRNTDADAPEAGSPEDVKIAGGDDKDDVDRPTLRRRPAVDPKTAKKNKKGQGESGVFAEKGSLNDDPDRPTIKRKTATTEEDFPALNGLPPDMKQMVAVSDAKNREPHPFVRPWDDDAEKAAVMGKLREIARAELVKYGPVPVQAVASTATPYTGPQLGAGASSSAPAATGAGLSAQDTAGGAPVLRRNKVDPSAAAKEQVTAPVVAAPAAAAAAKPAAPTAAALAKMTPVQRRAALAKAKKAAADAAKVVPEVLLEEELKGFTLSYGGAPTYVYTAHTAGTGSALRYVTIVAQGDPAKGEMKVAMKGVTDAAHLDRTAWMRFVDVVDVEASNRASLLFELRGQSSRQFGVYRVIDGRADTVFLGGTTQ